MRKTARLISVLTYLAMSGLPLQAGQCGYADCWGAIGFSGKNNGTVGFSFSHWSEAQAYDAAQDHCNWNCAEMRTFKNTCAAIVQGKNGSWSWAKGDTRRRAIGAAHSVCEVTSHGCSTVVWACSR